MSSGPHFSELTLGNAVLLLDHAIPLLRNTPLGSLSRDEPPTRQKMVTKPTRRTPFAGIDRNDGDVLFPGWFRDMTGAPAGKDRERATFMEAVGSLPRADKRGIAYWDNEAGEWRHDDKHYAVVNPDWLGVGLDQPNAPDSAVWHVARGRYTCVNPMEIYGPLTAAIRRYNANPDAERPLGDVFGEVREYRNGGEVHLDVVFDRLTVADPATGNGRFVMGIQTGTDHFGGRSTYARIVLFDTEQGAAMRGLTKQRKRKHTGTATKDVADWWTEVLETLETAADTIFGIISTAREYEIDFSVLPFDVEGFYDHLGFPEGLAVKAAREFEKNSPTTTAWALYLAMARTITNDYDVKDEGDALKKKLALANRILWEPPRAEADALKAAEAALRGQQTFGEGEADAADALADRRESITATIKTFSETRKRLATILEDAEQATEEGATA